jgi:cell division protein FtsN
LEIAWAKSPVDVLLLQVQGSGWLVLPDGRSVRVRYAANNGRPYRSIGRFMLDRKLIPRYDRPILYAFMESHPDERQAVLNQNPRYVFFSLDTGENAAEVRGSLKVPLTALRSIATDPAPASDSAGWGASTEVVPHAAAASPPEPARAPEIGSPFVTQVAAVAEPGRAPAASAGGSGGIKLQVASVRSRSEAEALAGLLVGRHGEELGGRRPAVDQTVIGSMGTFYRVRIGPFANDREPQQLCNVLKPDGFDCLVVTE